MWGNVYTQFRRISSSSYAAESFWLTLFRCLAAGFLQRRRESREEVHRQRKYNRRVLFHANLSQSLQVPQLDGKRLSGERLSGICEPLGRREFTFRMDDFGTLFAFRLGLLGHGALHRVRQVYLLDLHVRNLYAIRRGVSIKNGLNSQVQLVTVGQQLVQIYLAQYRAQSGLGKLLRLPIIVLHLDDRLIGAHHTPVNYGIHFERDVVTGDDVLWRDFQGLLPQIDSHDPVHRSKNENDAWPLGVGQQAAQAKDHAAFIFAKNLDGTEEIQNNDHCRNQHKNFHNASVRTTALRVDRILVENRRISNLNFPSFRYPVAGRCRFYRQGQVVHLAHDYVSPYLNGGRRGGVP